MKDKFIKGYTYLVRCNNVWLIVNQTGQRSWAGMCFTHQLIAGHTLNLKTGNATSLFQELEKSAKNGFDVRRYTSDVTLRKAMFSILKYGEVRDE